MVGKAIHKRGVKQVSTPISRGMTTSVYLSDMECSYPLKRGILATCRGVVSYPPLEMMKMKINQETRIDSQSMRMCSSKKQGELDEPPKFLLGYWFK